MKKTILLLFIMTIIAIAFPPMSMAAENLQTMIDSLDEGAVLQLENKTYEGNITIDKPIETHRRRVKQSLKETEREMSFPLPPPG